MTIAQLFRDFAVATRTARSTFLREIDRFRDVRGILHFSCLLLYLNIFCIFERVLLSFKYPLQNYKNSSHCIHVGFC